MVARAAAALALGCALCWPAGAAVKSSGTVEIYDDLTAGFAGSVDLAGGNIVLSGSLGQVAASAGSGGGTEAESGYFSKYVSTPASVSHPSVYSSSSTVTAAAATYPNPSGTLYELETSSSSDFSGSVVSVSTTAWPAPVTGLAGNTTYYTRLRASYMGEDLTAYTPNASFMTLPSTPSALGYTGVFSSSLTVAWTGSSNSPETIYFAQIGPDPGFTAGSFATTTSSSYTFTSLSPNTTYFVRLKAIGDYGDETAYVLFGSTITTAVTPSTTVPCAVSSVTLTAYWGANGNPDATRYLAQVSTDDFATVLQSSVTVNVYAYFTGLQPDTTHYVRVAALNTYGAPSLPASLPDSLTAAAPPLQRADTFTSVTGFDVGVQWLANGNPPGTQYSAQASSAADFSAAASSTAWSAGVSATLAGLYPDTTYYFRVKARNAGGTETAYESLGSTVTLTAVDTSSPTITDNQSGDAVWRSSNSAVYDLDLQDYGGSYLKRLQVSASTGPGGTGTQPFGWSDALTNINAASYQADWGLTAAQWALLAPGTNYISVRAYDGIGNYAELADAFYVLKDTVAPTVTDNQAGETEWRREDPGAVYQVNFGDEAGGGGLAAVEYSAASEAGAGNANIIAWTALPGLTPGATYYDGPWALDFGALDTGVTNYISVRARDLAGNTTTVNDAFLVLKNDSGPEVRLTAPSAGFHSALAAISGTAAPVLAYSITGTEITIQDTGSGKYWDGTDFLSATGVWLAASGQTSWSYSAAAIPWVSGTQYQVVARSSDTALNYSLPYATATFTFDQSSPTAHISTPAAGAALETPSLIAGTAADTSPNSGVPYVSLTLRRAADLKWWNFFTGAWGETEISTMTPGGASWSFSPDDALRGNLLDGSSYYVYAAARDGAVPPNQTPAGLAASTFTVVDTVPPGTITVSSASQGQLPGRLLVTWTASGDDGDRGTLGQGWFAIKYSTYPEAVFSTQTAQVLISTAGAAPGSTQSALVSGLVSGVTYYVVIWASDEAGLWSVPSSTVAGRAGISLADSISGNVLTPAGAGVTGVLIEAYGLSGLLQASAYSLDDGTGSFVLSDLPEGIYRVQATWIEEGFASSVASDQIPTGYAEVAFRLSVDYQLASVGGVLEGINPSPARYAPSSAGAARVELYQRGRLIAVAPVGAGGRFLISGLLPGSYELRVPEPAGGSRVLPVTLAPGQDLRINPLAELLPAGGVYAYPNPASGRVSFHVRSAEEKHVSVFDVTGRALKEFRNADFVSRNGGWEADWDIPAGVASGVYIYSARVRAAGGEGRTVVKKFAVVR